MNLHISVNNSPNAVVRIGETRSGVARRDVNERNASQKSRGWLTAFARILGAVAALATIVGAIISLVKRLVRS